MSRSLNTSSRPSPTANAAASCMTAYAVERLGEGATFDLDAWQLVPVEYERFKKAQREVLRVQAVIDSVPEFGRVGAAWEMACERVDLAVDALMDAESVARAAFRKVAA